MYKLIKHPFTNEVNSVFKLDENKSIPMVEANTDYQAYLKWLEAGNQPEPADDQT